MNELRPIAPPPLALAELHAWKQAQAAMTRGPGVNPQRRIRRALAKQMGVSPKTLRKLAKRHTRETKAQIAALRSAAARAPEVE